MLQLAIGDEFSGKEKEAVDWFGRIASDFPKSDLAPKAAGAKRRLESVGKTIPLKGKTLDGRPFDLAAGQGQGRADPLLGHLVRAVQAGHGHDPALQAKYGKEGFVPIGVNLDNSPAEATDVSARPTSRSPGRSSTKRAASKAGWPPNWAF